MKYIFWGTPTFAATVLEKLIIAETPPIALVCNPDRPVGRKKIITPPPTKALLSQLNIKSSEIEILQPDKLNNQFLNKLRELKADFYVVAAYGKILRKELLEIPPLGVIGVHPSLLPKYRGASPIQTTILNGDTETGVALFMIDEGIDSGEIVTTRKLKIENKSYLELEKDLASLAGEMLIEILPRLVRQEIKLEPQDNSKATFTRKFETEDGFVDYESVKNAQEGNFELAKRIHNKIRALSIEPGVYTTKNNKRIKLLGSRIESEKLQLTKIQYEGKTMVDNKNRL